MAARGPERTINRVSLDLDRQVISAVDSAIHELMPLEAENARLREQAVELALQIQRLRESRSGA